MKKYIFTKCLMLFLVMGFIPSIARAANVYLETSRNTVSAGDTFIIRVKIDAENKDTNSVEGDIVLQAQNNNFVVNDFSLAKSPFTLWPQTPSLSQDGNTVSFTGGVPGGFNSNKVTLFNIIVETSKEGDIEFSPKNIIVFANDGQGTKLPVTASGLTIKVEESDTGSAERDEWADLVNQDKENPSLLLITLGREPSLFEGKIFAFFTAIDNQSGISYYEVSEDGNPAVRSGSMYVLSNQDNSITPNLVVTAYDKAGNKTVAVYKTPGFAILGIPLYFFIVFAVIFIIWVLFRIIKRNKKHVRINQQV